jgi:exopolyphosphatase/guanosine-5'-triphosphate,3'-diphosphate pyrophosphatase
MRIAAIDLGTNSLHMLIAEVEADGRFSVLDRAKVMVRLGRGKLKRLPRSAMEATLASLSTFKTLAERQGVTRFAAVATSAVREAGNGGEFLQRIHDVVGLRVKVIPGREEARLIHLGVAHALDLRGEPTLIVDVGGGSVEAILVEHGKAVMLESLKLGVARLSHAYLRSDPPRPGDLRKMEAHIAEALAPVLRRCRNRGVRRVVATSGTLLNAIEVVARAGGEVLRGRLNGARVAAEEVLALRRRLGRADRSARLRIKGLDAKRVDTLLPGVVILAHVLAELEAPAVLACTWALREGILLDFIARHRKGIEETERFVDVRRRSVQRLVRHLGREDAHSQHVTRLALRLFDQLHRRLGLGATEREWLEYAAVLHDVGHVIAHHDHHRHTHYLVAHGALLGFDPAEREIIGQTARYHRKAAPQAGDPDFRRLSRDTRRTVRALSALLRVADGLDRSHYGVVRDVVARVRNGRVTLSLATDGADAAIEMWEAGRRADLLREVMGMEVAFRVAS